MTPSDSKRPLDMIEVKTRDLIGAALDWAVAKAEGHDPIVMPFKNSAGAAVYHAPWAKTEGIRYQPSTDGQQGTPLVERFRPHINPIFYNDEPAWECWSGWDLDNRSIKTDHVYGPTLLIASMRCYVSSKHGETLQVPALLLQA
jgi:hypothetical protein